MSLYAAAAKTAKNQQIGPSSIANPAPWLRNFFGSQKTASGIEIDEDNAISISTVFNVLTLLSESIAQLPLAPFIEEEEDGLLKKRKFKEHNTFRLVAKQPNDYMTSYTFRKVMMNHLVRYDRAFAFITRNGRGQPAELFPLHPKRVRTKIAKDGDVFYEVTNAFGSGKTEIVSFQNMLHPIGYTDNGIEGKSRIRILAESLGNTKAAERFTGHFFGKGVNVSGFIKTPKMLKDEDAVERLKTSFVKKYGGANGEFGVGLLEGGAEWEPNEVEPEKAQLNETRKVNGVAVAQIWNIPLSLLKFIERNPAGNVEQLDIQFTKYTLNPWLVNWEQEYEARLLSEREKQDGNIFYKHNVDGLLRGDIESRGQFYERMQRTGAFSPNDILRKEDENPYEGGNIHVINPGAQSVEQLNQAGQ